MEKLEAAVKGDQPQIDQANVQLGYTRLTSAIPGVTGIRQIDVGNVIHPTGEPYAHLDTELSRDHFDAVELARAFDQAFLST